MNWYLSKIVYQIICGDGKHIAQFDEQLRLIAAENEEQAFQKAQEIGKEGEDCFENTNQKTVLWQFINVAELYKISLQIDGAELFSTIRESEDADTYTKTVHLKAAHIKSKKTHQLLQLI